MIVCKMAAILSSPQGVLAHVQYIPRNMHTVFALLCFVVVIHWLIFPYPSGLLHWHCGNLTIAPVPAKQPWWIWINTSCEFIMNDCITTTKQSTTKPCAYFLGYTVVDTAVEYMDTSPLECQLSTLSHHKLSGHYVNIVNTSTPFKWMTSGQSCTHQHTGIQEATIFTNLTNQYQLTYWGQGPISGMIFPLYFKFDGKLVLQGIITLQNFADAMTAQLSCHVQNSIATTSQHFGKQENESSIKFELW